ncbi:VOC family protein [Aquimarina sp. 2201CG5-10]|uniref:VOC family protein n=1 Tax=Aquimarina callyspongiae TaxID=3098150 RepID=UPI002AB38CA0|nr:VOC family protein [Aquimarina sp. 2201CG5-10]MDY8134580.1 glyoxalase/bleomycin resistance/dioxygenase family protein [Aquimarina sp. 2201CG5-10]
MIAATRTGLILYVKKYNECVSFYKEILQLPVLFQNEVLTCFDFYGTYLMVEIEDREEYLKQNMIDKNYSCLRLNVANVETTANMLKAKGIEVNYQKHEWGEVAKFFDPEGNMIAFKDESGFADQIEEYSKLNK